MERTKMSNENIENDGKIRFKKIGGGSFRFNRRIIKPGQVFMAYPREIPSTFRNVCIPLDQLPEGENEIASPVIATKSEYKLQLRGKSLSLYDVVDKNGKVLNEKGLKKEIAEKMISDLLK